MRDRPLRDVPDVLHEVLGIQEEETRDMNTLAYKIIFQPTNGTALFVSYVWAENITEAMDLADQQAEAFVGAADIIAIVVEEDQ